MAVRARWNTVRLEKKFSEAISLAAGDELQGRYEQAADEVNRVVSQRIEGSQYDFNGHKAEFAHQDKRVFRSAAGRWNISVGWINPPAHANERGSGGKLWYQYWDVGFNLFGNPNNPITGIGATIDRRENLLDALERVNYGYVKDLAKILD